MTSAWDHLPNAAHIDRVLEAAKENHYLWEATWKATRAPLQITRDREAAAASSAECVIVDNQERYDAWTAAWNVAQDVLAWDALLALCAYDDCAYMLDSDPGELAILAVFGNPGAILLLPACKAFHLLKTIA